MTTVASQHGLDFARARCSLFARCPTEQTTFHDAVNLSIAIRRIESATAYDRIHNLR